MRPKSQSEAIELPSIRQVRRPNLSITLGLHFYRRFQRLDGGCLRRLKLRVLYYLLQCDPQMAILEKNC
jgi:hypothetical protein